VSSAYRTPFMPRCCWANSCSSKTGGHYAGVHCGPVLFDRTHRMTYYNLPRTVAPTKNEQPHLPVAALLPLRGTPLAAARRTPCCFSTIAPYPCSVLPSGACTPASMRTAPVSGEQLYAQHTARTGACVPKTTYRFTANNLRNAYTNCALTKTVCAAAGFLRFGDDLPVALFGTPGTVDGSCALPPASLPPTTGSGLYHAMAILGLSF